MPAPSARTIDINQVITPEWAVRMNVMGRSPALPAAIASRTIGTASRCRRRSRRSDRLKFVADYTYVPLRRPAGLGRAL